MSDAGLKHLVGLENLNTLTLPKIDAIMDGAIEKLKESLPNAEIEKRDF